MNGPEVRIDFRGAHEPTQDELSDLRDFLLGAVDVVESDEPKVEDHA